jgi:DNA-binding GntR family transcriptional regulator
LKSAAVQAPSAVDQVIAAIERGIQQARFAPGQRLIESELMVELGISRGPVREAFRRLAATGLLQWERFRGVSVIRMTRQQVLDLSEIRGILEGHAASLAAAKIDRQGRAALKSIERVGNSAIEASSSYDEYNVQFHKLILSLSGNKELPSFVERTQFSIFRLQFNTIILSPRHLPRSRADHARIVEAIMDGDSKAAEQAMKRHVNNTTAGILEAPSHFFAA